MYTVCCVRFVLGVRCMYGSVLYSTDVVCLCVHVCIAALCWGCLASGTNSSAVNCVSGYSCPSVTGPYWAHRYRLLQPSLPVEWASRTFSVSLPPLLLEPISPVSFPPKHIHSVPALLQLMLSYTSMICLLFGRFRYVEIDMFEIASASLFSDT